MLAFAVFCEMSRALTVSQYLMRSQGFAKTVSDFAHSAGEKTLTKFQAADANVFHRMEGSDGEVCGMTFIHSGIHIAR